MGERLEEGRQGNPSLEDTQELSAEDVDALRRQWDEMDASATANNSNKKPEVNTFQQGYDGLYDGRVLIVKGFIRRHR